MAIRKTITSRAGFEMDYWKINSWNINMGKNIMDITLIPYISSDTREGGLEPINEEIRKIRIYDRIDKLNPEKTILNYTNNFSPAALENLDKSIYQLMYDYIKENVKEFEGAEDI